MQVFWAFAIYLFFFLLLLLFSPEKCLLLTGIAEWDSDQWEARVGGASAVTEGSFEWEKEKRKKKEEEKDGHLFFLFFGKGIPHFGRQGYTHSPFFPQWRWVSFRSVVVFHTLFFCFLRENLYLRHFLLFSAFSFWRKKRVATCFILISKEKMKKRKLVEW